MTSWTWVSSHNHWTRAPTMVHFRSIVGLYLNKVVPDKFRVDKVTLNAVVQWREPWYSGYGRRLTWQRSWVRILAPYTGYLFEKTENKRKRGPGWPILKNKQMVLDELALNTITHELLSKNNTSTYFTECFLLGLWLINKLYPGGRHSSMVSSAFRFQRPWFQIPSIHLCFFQFILMKLKL